MECAFLDGAHFQLVNKGQKKKKKFKGHKLYVYVEAEYVLVHDVLYNVCMCYKENVCTCRLVCQETRPYPRLAS